MLTCVVAMKVSEFLEAESAFTGRLRRKGENLRAGMDFSLLDGLAVKDVMDRDYVALPARALITEIADLVSAAENRTFPVAGEGGRLVSIVTLANLIAAGTRSAYGSPVARVADLLRQTPAYLEPDDSLGGAWDKMGHFDYDCLPVCRPGSDGLDLVGICEKEAISEMHDRQTFIRMPQGLRPPQGQ